MHPPIPVERLLKRAGLPLLLLLALALAGCATGLQSRVGFQGQLTDPAGDPVPDGTYEMTVRFYPEETGSTSVFTETKSVEVSQGLFNLDIDDFPPHIFSSSVAQTEQDTLYMEVEVDGETLAPRRKVAGSPFAHALVAGSGVVGARQDKDTVTDGGYGAALTVINTELPTNNAGYAISARAANAGLFADNVTGAGDFNPSPDPEANADLILGGEYVTDVSGSTTVDTFGGPGVLASDPALPDSDLHLRSSDEIWLYKDYDNDDSSEFRIYDGGTNEIQLSLNNSGDLSVDGAVSGGGADFAERITVEGNENDYEPGDVLVISDEVDRAVELADEAYSSRVIGVYSTNPGFIGGAGTPEEQRAAVDEALARAGYENGEDVPAHVLEELAIDDGAVDVAIAGIVPVKVSTENGPVLRGDLLTTSATPGHAMKATEQVPGTILGKAMGTLEEGTGVIEALVILQ